MNKRFIEWMGDIVITNDGAAILNLMDISVHRRRSSAGIPDHGIGIAPGMKIQYVVTDARRYRVEPAWCAKSFNLSFYRELIDTAYAGISFAFSRGKQERAGIWNESVLRNDAGSGKIFPPCRKIRNKLFISKIKPKLGPI